MLINNDLVKSRINFVRMCGELACLLEVSASPKPGNVHRFSDFKDLRYEDFLGSGVSLGYWLEELALKGIQLATGELSWDDLALGATIKHAVKTSDFFHEHSNTNLGIILLLCPLSVAAGMSFHDNAIACDLSIFQSNLRQIMSKTTVHDAIAVSEAVKLASPGGLGKVDSYAIAVSEAVKLASPGGLGKVDSFDVTGSTFKDELLADKTNLLSLMDACKERDNICFELSQGYPITFETGLEVLHQTISSTKDINLAVINTYIGILARYPDTLIGRKFGKERAEKLAEQAMDIIQMGGSLTLEGRRELEGLDIELREEDEKINPGTTADLVAAVIFIYLLTGGKLWRSNNPF
ncbi:MAG: triphosphoribosyl-dephospho-CoA synthase [Candidatus Heimdallarchaeota archaeon]